MSAVRALLASSRIPAHPLGLLTLGLLATALPLTAQAEERGLVVRLTTGGEALEGTVTVALHAEGRPADTIELKDDGAASDVTAADGTWSGATWLAGDDFAVVVHIGSTTIDGGKVSWQASDAARDLAVSLQGGTVTVETGVSGTGVGGPPTEPAGPGAAGDPGAGGGTPSEPGAPPPPGGPIASGEPGSMAPGGAPGAAGALPPTSSKADSSLYIAFGLGTLVLVAIAWLWLRNRPAEGASRAGGVTLVPEPGLLGDGTPSLADGLMVWIAGPDDAAALVTPLAATLARHHRVLFAAPSASPAPSVFGGPVFRAANVRPSHLGDAAEALQREGGAPVAVLITGAQPDAGIHKDYADLLPTGAGGVSIVPADPGVAGLGRVTARRDGTVWVLQSGERTMRMIEGPSGFTPESAG